MSANNITNITAPRKVKVRKRHKPVYPEYLSLEVLDSVEQIR
ncbi:hypothetical protein MIDIC_230005 [Alphaproteobacteria bacterium]